MIIGGEGHECTVGNVTATANTPKRVNSGLTQFQLFEGESHAVNVKNVAFVYEPAAFTVCENSGWKGTFTAEQAPAGQIYLMNTGNVTFEGCSFDKVVLTSFNCTGTSTVTNCSFKNVYNSYAVKDIRGKKVAVTGCTFENCGAAVMVSSTVKVEEVTISGNTFKNVDVAGTTPDDKVGTRGLVQIASSGDYADTAFDFSDNKATDCGPVLRQLNETVSFDADDKTNLGKLVSDGGASTFYTDDTFVAQVGDTKYATLAEAITDVQNGETIVVNAGEYKLNGNLTYTGKAFTIQAAEGAKVSFDMSAAVALHGAKITFSGVTFDYKTNGDYIGLQHTDTLVYNDCTVNGKVFLYAASETFNRCTFVQAIEDYNVWTYGAKSVTFNDCTFKNVGKTIHAYIEGSNASSEPQKIEMADCTVESSKSNKAVVNIKNKTQAYDITLTGKNEVSGIAVNETTKSAWYQVETTDSTDQSCKAVSVTEVKDDGTKDVVYVVKPYVAAFVTVTGIAGFADRKYASFAEAYAAIKPTIESLGLVQESATADAFDALFTSVDANGNATLTYTISGTVVYDETDRANLLTMGRKASHYGNGRHLINFKFVGATGKDTDTLTVNSNITLPYEWWSEKTTTGIHFENLTITGSAPHGLYPSQPFFEGIDFSVSKCTLKGIKIYNCSNVEGSYTITDSVLDGTGAPADSYAIHLQGNETAPLSINIKGNTISGYDRGINIDQKTAIATIERNTISVKDAGRSCIQLSSLATANIVGNTLELTGGNAITLHENLLTLSAAPEVSISGNTVTGTGYLVYDDAVANSKAFTSDSLKLTYAADNVVAETVNTTQGVKGSKTYGISTAVNNEVQHYVATVGTSGYTTLAAAYAALNAENHTLALLKENAWDAATPVYWAAGTQSGYVKTLTEALTAAYKANAGANAGAITIVCRPGADVGTMTHGHVADDLTIYGNDAFISGGECDLEVDQYKYSRATGAQAADGAYLEKDITITAYELDNLGVWGDRHTAHTVTVNLTDCDGKALEGKTNVQRVYISGTTGVNNITLTGCDFLTKATAVYSNADGAITAVNCSFTDGQVPFNINHKANGKQTVAVENCTFTNCGDAAGDWKQFAAPLRLVNSGTGTQSAEVTGCAFAGTVGANGDILLGDGRTDQASNDVELKVVNTAANIQAQKPGYYGGETVDATKMNTAASPAEGTLETSVAKLLPVDPRTLGYATSGKAEALPATPDMNGAVVDVTAAQAQYVLDGAYGPIDGKTINFTESINDTLILGRASKYDGSKTVYRHGSHVGEALSYADFIAYKNQSGWTQSCYYERTVENVTFTANEGVTVKNFEADGGEHIYAGTAPVYDYVRDTGSWVTKGSCYYKRAILKNITFKGLTFKAKTDINTSESTTVYDGFTFKDCTFDLGTTADGNQAIRYYNENNNGNVKNLVVEGCTFKNCSQGVYTMQVKGITVKDSTFTQTGHNAIAIQSQGGDKGPCNHGEVVITGNTMVNIGDRAIRFNVVAAGTTITITGNTAAYGDGTTATDKQCIKAETLAEGVTTTVELNNWNNYAVAANKPLTETVAKIGTTDYKSLEDATEAAQGSDVITIVGYTSNMTAPDGWKFETAEGVTTLVADPVLAKGEDGKFHIASYDDLLLFKKMVNEKGMNFSGETVVLDANIDMASVENWQPIGNNANRFKGTFDGQNHVIDHMTVNGTGGCLGLFGYCENAAIKDLTVQNASVTGSGAWGGVISGSGFVTSFTNVKVLNSTVNVDGAYVGGVVGGNYSSVYGSTVTGNKITGKDQVGGVMGYVCGTKIQNCTVTDNTVTATEERAGLLAGKIQSADSSLMSITGNTVGGTATAPDMAGGIAAQIMGSTTGYEVRDNTIDGTLTAQKTSPIGVLRSNQPTSFTTKMATNITGNWWENSVLNASTYTYAASETNGAGDQVITRGVAQVGTTTYKTLAEALSEANSEGALCELIADVTLKGTWTSILNFKGTFDGKDHKITGLNVSGSEYVGLIGVLDGGTVKNVQFASVDVSGGTDAGSAVGRIVNNGTVDHVKVLSGTVKGTKRVGGVVGSIKACGTVKNCENAAKVEASTYNVGGIVGAAYYTETGKEMYITVCRNTADITSAGVGAGGIVGLSCANVSGNTNTGAVKGQEVGGIVGEQKTYGSVTGNTNSGAVTNTGTGNYGTGGIIGWLRYHGTDENAAYPQSAIITVSGNSNSGTITGANDAGGIVGVVYNSAVITDNSNTAATLSGTTFAAGIVGNYQITETPAAVEPAKNKLTFTGNTSTTTLDNITANNKDLLIYDNRQKVAQIGDKKYATLAEAVEAAKIGDTIKVIANDASLSVPEGWTISGSTLIPVDKTWHIANLDQLKEFQSAVNGGNTFDGQTVVLDAGIDMASVENWQPIGNASEKKFAGTFDGQNHTINGLKITGGSYVGLFGYLGAATVQNVALVGANVSGVKRVGALVGQIAGNATIKNCSLDATSSVAGSDSNTGGLIGEASGSIVVTLENLTNNAPVTNTESGTSRAAGILCQATSGASVTLKNCVNKGTITTNGGYAGGIVSAKQGGASLVFDGCSNTGTLANGTKGTGALLAWSCNGSSVTISNYSGDVANAIGWLSQDNYDHVFVINGVEHYIRVAKGGSGYTFASRYEVVQLMDKSYLQEIIGFFDYAKSVNNNFAAYPATPVEVLKSAYSTRDGSIKGSLFNTDVSSGWPQLLSQYNEKSGKSLTADDFAVTWGTRDVLFMVADPVPVNDGSEAHPYSREQFAAMTRADYIKAQERLGGTLYVNIGDYAYEKNGVLGNGVRDNTPGQVPDHSKLNAYGENGYLGGGNDGANGHAVVFVGGTITSGVTGYTSIDNIGTSLLLAVPAYTKVTFKGTAFKNVLSFDYQLYTSPWSQLGGLTFKDCTFNGIIVGAIASQELAFNGCTFNNYVNKASANSSNPTWIRPAYGNWTKGDNEGQGTGFRSLTKITFENNTVTSTRPVKFERIAQWEMATTVTATGNTFTITPQAGDTSPKNVGLYFGANAKFDLVIDNNAKSDETAALYTAEYKAPTEVTYVGLPAGSTVKNAAGEEVATGDGDALAWKTTKKITLKTTEEVASVTNATGVSVNFATLSEAVKAAQAGETVTLLADITLASKQSISKELTLDLNGKTLTGTAYQTLSLGSGANVTIQDSSAEKTGKVANGYEGRLDPYTICLDGYGAAALTLVSGTVEANPHKTDLQSVAINTNHEKDGPYAINIKGGKVFVPESSTNGRAIVAGENVTLTVEGGEIVGGLHGVDVYGSSTTAITGGSISARVVDTGVIKAAYGLRAIGTASVTIGAADGTADVVSVAGIKMDDDGYKLDVPTVTVNSGTIAGPVYSITKGTIVFNVQATSEDVLRFADDTAAKFLPSNLELRAKDIDGKTMYYVAAKPVAAIGAIGYETLEAALAAAKDGETVKLLADVTESVTIAADRTLTLDLNGKTLSAGKASEALTVTGHLTIDDTSAAKSGRVVGDGQYVVYMNNRTAHVGESVVGGSLTLNAGSLEGATYGVYIRANQATLTMNGGKVSATKEAIRTDNDCHVKAISLLGGEVGDVFLGSDSNTELTTLTVGTADQTDPAAVKVGKIGLQFNTGLFKLELYNGLVGELPEIGSCTATYTALGMLVKSNANCPSGKVFEAIAYNGETWYRIAALQKIAITFDGSKTVALPFATDWLKAHVGKGEASWTTAALEEKAENGLAKWQCYLFGLDPRKEDAKVVATAGQGTDEAIPLTVANADASASPLVKGGYVTVAYVLMGSNDMGSNDGTAWTQVATSDKRDGLAIPLTGTTYKFYRVDVTVTSAEGN